MDCEVLVVGAGPSGLVAALVLARAGVAVRVVERRAGPVTETRAIGVQARTLELYRMLGLADRVVSAGLPLGSAEIRVNGRRKAVLPVGRMGASISPYPYVLSYSQETHEAMLVEALAAAGVAVEWRTEMEGFEPDEAGVTATLRRDVGVREVVRAGWLIGADGGRSRVREGLGIGFSGTSAAGLFYVADVEAGGIGDHLVLGLGRDRLTGMVPLPNGRARFIGIVPPGSDTDGVTVEDVLPDAKALLGMEPTGLRWFSTYHVRHRVAERFRAGRCFLVGDAGHVHSPVGGQGMNTGIGDAVNLAWKLAQMVRGEAGEALLDSYGAERIPFARALVETTDSMFLGLVDEGWVGRTVRMRVVPGALGLAARLRLLGPRLFRLISQTRVEYRASALSEGAWAGLTAGERLPWLPGMDNHAGLDLTWQVHVHGPVGEPLRAWAASRGVALRQWPWSPEVERAGLRRGAALLVRPDGHVAVLCDDAGARAVEALDAYAARWGLWATATAPSSNGLAAIASAA